MQDFACMPSCETISYTISSDNKKINFDEECHSADWKFSNLNYQSDLLGNIPMKKYPDISQPYDLTALIGEKTRLSCIDIKLKCTFITNFQAY